MRKKVPGNDLAKEHLKITSFSFNRRSSLLPDLSALCFLLHYDRMQGTVRGVMIIPFVKMNGAGNDFVMLDNRDEKLNLSSAQIARICDRHRGVGADGLLLLTTSSNGKLFRMRYYNSDGGEAEMCGNGARCFARFTASLLDNSPKEVSFETAAGVIQAKLDDNTVDLIMSEPHSFAPATKLAFNGKEEAIYFINTGVPHAILFVDDLSAVDLVNDGAAIRYHSHFAPKGTNVNFVAQRGPATIDIRTYERGVEGETLACGTGVVASALVFYLKTKTPSPITVLVAGGDAMHVYFDPKPNAQFQNVRLQGPAEVTFRGELNLSF